ncbi:bacterial alpha-l-rhamnosidase domain-containing protein [Colletotrichum truncatum]|uniref:Bacterial alpha-l-rhamnosidase domain-containing protein n=1 Tax=Colletotrichum truncatum TaxID=5467 RepID=A0ACC3YEY0_COLTU|nr:bacterial alpha-l-rhamnosidase domain-containing protein [Colletotrichum truncatum]KAF6784988.1 bacterial alpha-l-rhamnosidase domain-containing protein [Colletotrichum truncatum]
MVLVKHLLPGLGLIASSLASSCWRNATCTHPTEASFPGPWDANIYAPDSRTARPKSVLSLSTGNVVSEFPGTSTLKGNGSALVFDFGVLVGGITTVNYTLTGADGEPAVLGLAWTEAKNWIGEYSDNSNGNYRGPGQALISTDGALFHNITAQGEGSYTVPFAQLRGGFRYLTLYLLTNSSSPVSLSIDDVSLEIVFQPTWSNLRAYQGYFHSSSDQLNKIWYSGAYTLQTNAAPPETGRVLTEAVWNGSWFNDAWLGVGSSLLLDGAKRDRWIWPGDMGVAVPSAFVSTGDLESAKNAIQTMFNFQQPSGIFPRAGPPYLDATSDTYHMWTMIGAYNYVLFSGDLAWLADNWATYLKAMKYIYAKIIPDTGILNATATGDWARYINSMNGSAPNMLLYRTLTTGAFLAEIAPSNSSKCTNLTATWLARAEELKGAIKTHLWDEKKGAFFDGYKNRTLYPQDANSYAVAFGVVDPSSPEAASISSVLTENWTPIGPASPELPGNISPFISSIELEAHFVAGRADRALKLIRDSWGWYLAHPNGTQSTVIEGYLVDGSFGYRSSRGYTNDPSYVSHAHGWSSGPTSTLTEYLVGLRVTRPAGQEWRLKPVFGELDAAQAGFTTVLGKFSAKWEVAKGVATVEWDAPEGTRGWLELGGEEEAGRWVDGGKGRAVVKVGEQKQ